MILYQDILLHRISRFHVRKIIFIKFTKFSGTSEDYTIWSVVKDLTNNIMFLRAHDYIGIRSIDLNRVSTEGISFLTIEDTFRNSVKDVTDEF